MAFGVFGGHGGTVNQQLCIGRHVAGGVAVEHRNALLAEFAASLSASKSDPLSCQPCEAITAASARIPDPPMPTKCAAPGRAIAAPLGGELGKTAFDVMRACIASVASWVKRNWRQDDRGRGAAGSMQERCVKAGQIRDASDELRDLQAAGLLRSPACLFASPGRKSCAPLARRRRVAPARAWRRPFDRACRHRPLIRPA